MEFVEVKSPREPVVNTAAHSFAPGRVQRALWHIPHAQEVRFLRFGFDMPGEPVFFGRMGRKDAEVVV